MTRCAILKRDEMNAEQGRVYDAAVAAGAPVGGPYWALIRNPKLMEIVQSMSACLRGGAFSPRERQIAVLVAIRHLDAEYPWAVQVKGSLTAGLEPQVIDAINARQKPALTAPRDQAIYDVTIELMANRRLSDATYNAAEKLFGVDQLVNLVATIGYFALLGCVVNAFDVTPPDSEPARLKR